MKKVTVYRYRTYALIGLISLTAVLSTTTPVLTQLADDSPIGAQTLIPASNLIWPTQGFISQGFRKYQHEGIDIAGASGTPIVAAASGTVIKAGWDNWGLGNAITIKHIDGSITVYGHNRRFLASKGQQVIQGQIIAEMGSTGNSTAPHLHFEVHPNGRIAVDPLRMLTSLTASVASAANQQMDNLKHPVSTPPLAKQVSPSEPIPIGFAPVSTDTKCNGVTMIEGETASIRVKVCEENGQLFYIGQLKQEPTKPIKIAALNIGKGRYRADNSSFYYLVSPEKVEVWRNGTQMRSDRFYNLTKSP
ncbi:Murein DD-endopeptidase MepM and murein hydrolase activator NlpD, containing LysM domain [Nostoc flagelliforme CCNUN1]|uniref:Murein DD-endopeptidase MepM and murein hydrolase activator NlpD, containing LysM domain n=1 Tax=Nostoc flagelliforme CCNUN1 TaxID=2038116 RepID=A0A2K8SGG0_9NOSO|nr:M23 family metallopeptidase [Nostoc flagelliforme]AUB34554.1 Murein DD-endopeptidase MepM and murein hydrolase activator NlpD, containing LysM domain [Nostoc flagelliforme CCNUN1]